MKKNKWFKRVLAFSLAAALVFTSGGFTNVAMNTVSAAEETIVGFAVNPSGLDGSGQYTLAWAPVAGDGITYKAQVDDNAAVDMTNGGIVVGMAEGTYSVKVTAYSGGNVVASATSTVTVPAAHAATGDNIVYSPKTSGGEGNGNGTQTPTVDPNYINLEAKKAETNGVFEFVAGDASNATITYSGNSVEFNGSTWGQQDWWSVQWSVQDIDVEAGDYIVEYDIVSTIAKPVYSKLTTFGSGDVNAPIIENTHNLAANVEEHYSEEVTFDAAKTVRVFYNVAGGTGEGKVIIKNVRVIPKPNNVAPEYIDLAAKKAETDGVFEFVAGDASNVAITYDGTAVKFNGSTWGQQDWWSVQWSVQNIDVEAGEYLVEYDIVSTIAKPVYSKLTTFGSGDVNAPIIENTHDLVANVAEHYSEEVTFDAAKTVRVFFNVAGGTGEGEVTIKNVRVVPKNQAGPKYINLTEKKAATDGVFEFVAGDASNVVITYDGTAVKFNGSTWGQQDWWSVQWSVQDIDVKAGSCNVEYDIVSTIDKPVYSKLTTFGSGDVNAPIIENTHNLKANVAEHYQGTATIAADGKVRLFFNVAGGTGEGEVIIKNILVGESSSTSAPVVKGKEYDFSATEDNAANDYAAQALGKAGYDLIWHDEFDGNYGSANVDATTGLNLDNWFYQYGDGTTDCGNSGWGNNELQCYTGDAKNIKVNEDLNGDGQADGLLRMTASYEENGYTYASESAKKYTSARIRTTKPNQELFNGTYGYYEARMSLPQTAGAWPAFWMLPQSTTIYGGWPVSGEIDIMETTGLNSNKACSTLHYGAPAHVYKGSGYVELNSEISYFHTYAVDWEPGKMTFYYDGEAIYTKTDWDSGFSGTSDVLSFDAPFDMPFYMILNLAVDSGQFGGAANKAKFKDDINMYVDYVRVYQRTAGYANSAVKTVSGDSKTDWASYAGKNQIAAIAGNVTDVAMGEDVNCDTTKWYLSTNANNTGGAATVVESNGVATVTISETGSQDYSVQLIGHYNAKAGYVYKISYDISGTDGMEGKTVNCDSKEWSGWSTYGVKQFALTDEPQTLSYVFSQTEDFDKCRVEFNIGGKGTGKVTISNVKVEIVDPGLLGGTVAEDGTRKPLSSGNVIFNSTFDQGTDHIGYWSSLNGTTLVVPRYTTTALQDTDKKVIDIASKTNYENIADGVKYYERRAQISAGANVVPTVYQSGFATKVDNYTFKMDMYSAADTDVNVMIYSTNADGSLKAMVSGAKYEYKAADGLKKLSLAFDVTEAMDNAALVLAFSKGASVQIDNVEFIGSDIGITVDETPVDEESTWSSPDAVTVTTEDGLTTVSGATSGSNWYEPQIMSDTFQVVEGIEYDLTMKVKFDDANNNGTFRLCLEEAGSYTRFAGDDVIIDLAALGTPDEDGYYTYERTFTPNMTTTSAHVLFGLGISEANATTFLFKDVAINKATVADPGQGGSGSTDQWQEITNSPVVIPTPVKPSTATVTTPVAEVKAPEKVVYTVVKGDTLNKIAKKYGVTLADILALNPQIKNPNRIYPGQKITIVQGADVAASTGATNANGDDFYTVVKGDCLYKIAKKFGIKLNDIYALNPQLIKQKYIYAGNKIRVK